MKLSAIQRRLLYQYRDFHESAPSVSRLVAISTWAYVRLLLVFTIAFALTWTYEFRSTALLLLGMVIGTVSRDFGTFRRMVKIWPVLCHVLDWKRIDELLEEEDGGRVDPNSYGTVATPKD